MRFRVLGPVEVWTGETWSAIRSPQQRTLLAILLIEVGRVVTSDRLVDEIWGEQPPRTAANIVQGYVMRLRRLIGGPSAGPLVTRNGGYQLLVEDDDVDAAVFDHLVEDGKHQLAQRRPRDGAARLTDALALWRGAPFADVPASRTVAGAAHQLEQRRLNAVEDRVDAELALGRHADIVDELYRLVGEAPLRERLLAQLMLALYRCGRRGEALDAYRAGSRVLANELALEPGTRLRALERAIRTDDEGVAMPGSRAAARVNPAQLPADVAGFTGRSAYLRQLSQRAPDMAGMGILTITGAAGVGKTALAVHWAHRVRHQFPDGQLYVNLRGYAESAPMRPIEALAGFLLALGVPAGDIPLDEARAAALYRSVLADTRTLVVLDNAHHADQVRPLLPGSPGCLVLITSRDHMRGLVALDGAVRLAVDVLTHSEARALLCLLLGESRVLAESQASDELAQLCGRLPLALRIAVADLVDRPQRTIADHVARLSSSDRLAALQVDGDRQVGVRSAFGLSYVAQSEQARRLFRLLGLVPGQDVTVPVAAALTGTTPGCAAELLDRLAAAHLIEERAAGRYTLHDLLRLYAAEQAGSAEHKTDREEALGRLHGHYLISVDAAARLVYPEKVRLPLPDLSSAEQWATCFNDNTSALNWLDAERPNLVAAIQHAAEHGSRATACLLADTLRGYLDVRMHTVDWLTVAQIGLCCAEQDGDLSAQAAAQLSLGLLHWKQSQYQLAVAHYTRAVALTGCAGWLAGHAAALGNLGRVYADLGRLELAATHHARALAIDRRTGWLAGQATKLGNLGEVYHDLGRLNDAMATLTEALDLHQQVGSRGSEAAVLRTLAVVHRDTGAPEDALRLAAKAVTVSRGIGGQRQLAKALNTLAAIHHELGDDLQALAGHQEALALARKRCDQYGEIEALTGLAAATCDHTEAVKHAEEAVTIARHAGARTLEARALTTLATIQLRQGQSDNAIGNAKAALTIHTETGQRLDQARTHVIAGQALRETGDEPQARDHLDAARALYIESGLDDPGDQRWAR